jgi:hypothetical protein
MAAAVAGPPGGEGGVSLSAGFQHLPGGRCGNPGRLRCPDDPRYGSTRALRRGLSARVGVTVGRDGR